MKAKILYLFFLFAFSISYAQIPTSGLQAMYEFTNGSLSDAANGVNFTHTGTPLMQVDDRLNNPTSSINLINGGYLSRPDVTSGSDITYSFWIKTNTDSFDDKMIIDDSQRNSAGIGISGNQIGTAILLNRGKITALVRMSHRARFTNQTAYSLKLAESGFIADGNWHHVVVRFNAYGRGGNFYSLIAVHIDGTLHDERDELLTNAGTVPVFESVGNVAVGNNRNSTLSTSSRYLDVIDDILIYNRELTAQEILDIRDVGGFCLAPSNTTFSSSAVTETSITLATPATEHEVAYHKSSEPFSNATIVSQVFNSTTINGLAPSTPYLFYTRVPCAATGASAWSSAKAIRTDGVTYVNASATGNNDGSSWADAYTDLRSSIFLAGANGEIWVASGTYKPHITSRDVYFHINNENLKIYGGFAGTETSISQRVVGTNETILSGDLQGNDANLTNYPLNYANSTRNADNSYHIINIASTGNNLLLDGLTISDAHNNLSTTERGGAIIKDKTVVKLTVKNCIIKDNLGRNDNAGLLAEFELNNTSGSTGVRGELIVENSQFINNMSRWGSGIYSFVRANTNVDITVSNSLFNNNLAQNLSTTLLGTAGSASWFRVIASGSNVTLNLTNNTYVNNKDLGTDSVNNFSRGVVVISKPSGNSSTLNAEVNNTIFWGNTGPSSGVTTRSITDLNQAPVNSLIINNSIDELNFNDDSISQLNNTSDSDPFFTDFANENFTLTSSSPAIDNGDNLKVNGIIDLLGNNRVFNTTVDMGAYEFGSSAPVYRTLTINATNGTVATDPNPTNGTYINGRAVELTATPDTGYQFDGWSGDASGTTNPLNITMDADKTITAIFSLIPAPTPTFINSPTSISGVFTATIQFDIAVTGFDVSDITVTGASLSNFTAVSGTNYTVDVTPVSICASSVTLKVPEDVSQNSSNVNNIASSLITIASVDNVDPVVTALSNTSLNLPLSSSGNTIVSAASLFSFSDNCTSSSTLRVVLSKGTTASAGTSQVNAIGFNCSEIGIQNVTLKVIDTAGNSANATATVTVVDSVDPVVVTQDITIQLDASGNASILPAQIDNGSTDNCGIAFMSLDVTDFTCANLGVNTVTLTAVDTSTNNSGSATATVTVTEDPSQAFTARAQDITVQLDANGNVTIIPSRVDNGSGSGCNSSPTLSLDKTSFTCADLGNNAVTLTATDGSTTDTAQATVTVVDIAAPLVITQDITVQLDANGNASITTTDIDNGSSDNCGIEGISLDTTSFTCVDIGTNTVTLTVVDSSANSANTTATVTVVDSVDPVVVTQDITIQLDVNGNASITTTDIDNGSTDNCGIASMSLDVTDFTCSNLGANTVTLTVTDVNGNSDTATAIVTVSEDPNQTLSAISQDITVQLNADGNITITPEQVDNGSGSGCNSSPTLSLDVTNFDCSNLGANTVVLTATDGSTTETATATVTVVDDLAPTIVIQNITVQLDASGNTSITTADIDNGSTDNCGIDSRSLDITAFTCANIGANTVTLTVEDVNGNVSTDTAIVTVSESVAPTVVTQDISVVLDVNGSVSITTADIDNGSTDDCSGIASMALDQSTFDCPTLGDVTVTLTVTDTSGNSATGTAVVTITGPDEDNDGISDACDSKEIVFEKGFSPNGDNQNDTWVLENIDNYPKNTVEIFNRWGERVYKANDYQNDWDGTANQRGGSSDKLPVGSYLYIINLNEPGLEPIQGWLYINY